MTMSTDRSWDAWDVRSGMDQARAMLDGLDVPTVHGGSAPEAANLEQTQEEMAFAHLRDMWLRGQAEFFVLTPTVVDNQIDFEAQPEVALSASERDEIVESVMNDATMERHLEAVRDGFRDIVRDHVRRVADGRLF